MFEFFAAIGWLGLVIFVAVFGTIAALVENDRWGWGKMAIL
jgi:hypothetical protein